MKKLSGIFIFVVFSFTFVSAYISDPIYGLGYGMNQLIILFENFLGPLFSILLGGGSEYLFERILFLFVIFSVVYIAISRMKPFEDKPVIIWIITIAVSLLSTRYLVESNLVQAVILPYSLLGVSITAFLPLIIYFTFVQSFEDSSTLRKVLWSFYIIVFVGLWASRYDEIGGLSWIYIFSGLAALIFLLADGTIRRAIIKQKFNAINLDQRIVTASKLKQQLSELDENAKYYPEGVYRRMRKRLIKQIELVQKH